MAFDDYFNKVYNKNTYNCAHFVCDVWEDITGDDIRESFRGFLLPFKSRTATFGMRHRFKRLVEPVEPSIVLMSNRTGTPHVGIYTRGKVLHIRECGGVQYQPLDMATFGHTYRRYYTCAAKEQTT